MKKPKLKVGDFFHVEVAEIEIETDSESVKFKLEIKDGPLKGYYSYLNLTSNPCFKEKVEKYIDPGIQVGGSYSTIYL